MVSSLPNIWKWLQPGLLGLIGLTAFVTLPEPLDKVLSPVAAVAAVLLAIYHGADLWGVFRREHAEYLAERERSSDQI